MISVGGRPFSEEKERRVELIGGRAWEERREGKWWSGCNVFKKGNEKRAQYQSLKKDNIWGVGVVVQ